MATVVNKTFRDQRSAAEKFVDERLKGRILAGIEALKKEHGDEWVDHIDPLILKLESSSYCILGQVYGRYENGLEKLHIGTFEATRYGFVKLEESWGELTQAWLDVLMRDPYTD